MEQYTVTVDEKVTIVERSRLYIQAESQEEANKKAIEIVKSGRVWEESRSSEYLMDTTESLRPDENDGFPTIFLYEDTDTEAEAEFYDNVNGEKEIVK